MHGLSSVFGVDNDKKKTTFAVTAGMIVFLAAICFFAYTGYTIFFANRAPRLKINISERLTEADLIKPQAPAKKEVTPAKTEDTAVLEKMLAEQTGQTTPTVAETSPVDVPSEKQTVPVPTSENATVNMPEARQEIIKEEKQVSDVLAQKETPAEQLMTVEKPVLPPPAAKKENPKTTAQLPLLSEPRPAPMPDLVKGALLESLPHFGNIKSSTAAIDPLPVLSPMAQMVDKDGFPIIYTDEDKVTHVPFNEYKRPYTLPEKLPKNTPIVAVLFSGAGMRDNVTGSLVNALLPEVSLSFSPYAAHLKKAVETARQAGHETFLDLPMQEGVFPATDPGPVGVVAGLPSEENLSRLDSLLTKPVAVIGLVGTMEETFSKETQQMPAFLKKIEKSGLVYVNSSDTMTTPSSAVFRPDVLINKNFYRSAIRQELERAKKIALEHGSAFIHAAPLPIVVLSIQDWMQEYQKSADAETPPELVFVPVSYLMEQRKSQNDK